MHKLTVSMLAGSLALIAFGCDGGAVDRVDNRWDCKQVCDRFAECFTDEDDYDVDGCKDECRDNANSDNDFESKLDECQECLEGDDSCAEETVECATECTGVVASSQG
jgi:hypothetical protein